MTRPACVLSVLLALAVARPVQADTMGDECRPSGGENPHHDPSLKGPTAPAAAVEHWKKGKGAHSAQDYDEAIAEFKAGVKVSDAPVFLYALGQSFRIAGMFEESIRSYKLFLDRAQPGPALRGVVECFVDKMQEQLARSAQSIPPTDQPDQTGEPAPPAATPRWHDDRVGLALGGGGAALAMVGGLLLWNAASLDEQAASEDQEPVRDDLRERADGRRRWGGVALGVGGAVLVAGVIKLALTPDAPNGDASRGVALVPGPGDLGLGVVGRF